MNNYSYVMFKLYALILINAIPKVKTLDILHVQYKGI